jgi:RNA polymerase sigma factor (sigma-70 family)
MNNTKSAKDVIFNEIKQYKILPDKEQRELLRSYQLTGDRNAANLVLKSNMKYIISAITRFSKGRITNSHPYFLEVLQEALIQVFRCFKTYNPDRAGIRVYANVPIRTAVSFWMNKLVRNKENLTENGYILQQSEDLNIIIERKQMCRYLLGDRKNRNKYVMKRYFADGARLREIANELGFSQERARQLKNKALKEVRILYKNSTKRY